MKQLLGAALVICTGAGAGIMAVRELNNAERLAADAIRFVLRLRTEVCIRRKPIPEAILSLENEFPIYCPKELSQAICITDISFKELWTRTVCCFSASDDLLLSLTDLGMELASGEEPERAFDRCTELLEHEHAILSDRRKRYSEIYLALGLMAGCVLTILTV